MISTLPDTRVPWERFQRIARHIGAAPRTAAWLAEDLEVTKVTIKRDVEFMRDRLGIEITSTRMGYQLANSKQLCPCCTKPYESKTI